MFRFFARVQHFLIDESGPAAVEYAVLLALIILALFTVVGALGNSVRDSFSNPTLINALSGGS